MLGCLVLIAGFCFSGADVQIHMQDRLIGYHVEVTAPTYQSVFGASDVPVMLDFRKAAKACAEGICVRYFKTCADNDAGTSMRCTYAFAWLGGGAAHFMGVTAANPAAIATAESEIQAVVLSGGKPASIALTLMRDFATPADLMPCSDGEACNPP